MQKRLYNFHITVYEVYADATLNALSGMLHLHLIIIYSQCTELKEDILLTRKLEIVRCTILKTNIFGIKHHRYYLDFIHFRYFIVPSILPREQLQFDKRL